MDSNADALSELLSDPEKLSAAVSAVSSVFGGRQDTADGEKAPEPAKQSEQVALIRALKPFLSPERQAKADRAIRLLTVAEFAYGIRELR